MSAQNVVKIGPACQQTQSPLMRLPLELRFMVYAHLFSSTRFTSGQRCSLELVIHHFIPAPHGLATLLSCRQAYFEIGNSWVSQVHFCFETAKDMVDKLADIPLETRSMIRHIRVSGHHMMVNYTHRQEQYDTFQILKLLPGLKLDILTVCGSGEAQSSYDALSRLVEYSDGWKELHYKSHTSGFIGYKPSWIDERDEGTGEDRFLREPQPGGWQRKLEHRDGSDSGASVTIYQSTSPYVGYSKPYISNTSTCVKFTQALAPGQDVKDYQQVEDAQLMAPGEIEKEMLVVVKRGRGADYEEKQLSPYLEAGDIREEFPGKTWAEMKASGEIESIPCEWAYYNDCRYTEKHVDLVDDYTHVDDYVWSPLYPFYCIFE